MFFPRTFTAPFLKLGNTWNQLGSSYQLKYNRFIIIAVNQDVQPATGCSIDSSVEFIQSLEQNILLI
jgi:hypothetical protein